MLSNRISFTQFFTVGILLLALYNIAYKLNYAENTISMANNLWNPSWLMFGPFLYFAVRHRIQNINFTQQLGLHFAPFIFFLIYFLSITLWSNGTGVHLLGFIKWYENLFLLVPISMVGYIIVLLPMLKRAAVTEEGSADLYFLLIAFFVCLVLIDTLMYLCQHVFALETGVNYYIYINYILVAMFVFALTFLIAKPQVHFINKEEDIAVYAKSLLKQEQVEVYINKIETYFKEEKPFLEYNISLNSLSEDLNIPKQHLTQVFNVFLKKSFYHYLATYRIEYALSLIQHSNITVEALANECGFSSKTSFNKYFKAITGLSPTAYLNQKIEA